jgi:hypothetical protein
MNEENKMTKENGLDRLMDYLIEGGLIRLVIVPPNEISTKFELNVHTKTIGNYTYIGKTVTEAFEILLEDLIKFSKENMEQQIENLKILNNINL